MSDEINTDKVADQVHKKVLLSIQELIPLPSCPVAKSKAMWKRSEATKKVITRLGGSEGLTIEIKA